MGLRLHFDEGIRLEFGEGGFIRAFFSWPIRLIGKKLKVAMDKVCHGRTQQSFRLEHANTYHLIREDMG